MPRVSFYTLGCKLNYAETSTIERDFQDRQFDVVPFGAPADVVVVNTCSVTAEAERKCRQVVRRALRASPGAFVVVTGCYAQLRPDEVAALDGVDLVLGAAEKLDLFRHVDAFTKAERTQVSVSCIDTATAFAPAVSTGERTRAFLKVQDGCDYACAFCTIPQARGRSRSQPVDDVVAAARRLAGEGYREVVLTGVNVGLYGQDRGAALVDLLCALDEVDGIERYRISSVEPNLLTDAVVRFVASARRFAPHFHLPLQSGDDFVLGRMRRRYRRGLYADRVARIRDLMPDAAIGADVIVGFPAETPERFENTAAFLDDLPVSYLHVFTYSERPGTAAVEQAGRMGAPVPAEERARRNRALRQLSLKKENAFCRAHLGTVRRVLWERAEADGRTYGYTDNYIRVERPADPSVRGRVEDVRLEALTPRGTVRAGEADFVSLL